MDSLIKLLETLQSMSPLAVIALMGVIIFMMTNDNWSVKKDIHTVKTNDLHELPAMAQDLRSISETIKSVADTLQRIEVSQSDNFSHIKARINGKR